MNLSYRCCKASSMLLILFSLLWTPSYTHTYPPNVEQIFYGDLSMENLILPEATENVTEADVKNIENMDVLEIMRKTFGTENYDDEYQDMANITVNGEDAKDYNDVSAKLNNFTRRWIFSTYRGHVDPADVALDLNIETKKQKMFEKLCLMYLYHSRYKMDNAFKQREPFREDKRYRIGYLFNRLRRLKTEMLKFVATAKLQYTSNWQKYQNLTSLMRMYERVVRFDVDIRDTVELIKHVYSIEAPFEFDPGASGRTKA